MFHLLVHDMENGWEKKGAQAGEIKISIYHAELSVAHFSDLLAPDYLKASWVY